MLTVFQQKQCSNSCIKKNIVPSFCVVRVECFYVREMSSTPSSRPSQRRRTETPVYGRPPTGTPRTYGSPTGAPPRYSTPAHVHITQGQYGTPRDLQQIYQDPVNLSERRPLHGLTGGAQKASGWTIGDIPRGSQNIALREGAYQTDPGHTNRVQELRVAEALAPLPEGDVSVNALDFPTGPPDPGLARPSIRSVRFRDDLLQAAHVGRAHRGRTTPIASDAVIMGLLRTTTDDAYNIEAQRIRGRDSRVARFLSDQFNAKPPSQYKTAIGATTSTTNPAKRQKSSIRRPSHRDKAYQNTLAPIEEAPPVEETLPGSNGATFMDRFDSPAGNFLQKHPTVNALGTVLLIDEGTFNPRLRSLTTFPAVTRANIGHPRV